MLAPTRRRGHVYARMSDDVHARHSWQNATGVRAALWIHGSVRIDRSSAANAAVRAHRSLSHCASVAPTAGGARAREAPSAGEALPLPLPRVGRVAAAHRVERALSAASTTFASSLEL